MLTTRTKNAKGGEWTLIKENAKAGKWKWIKEKQSGYSLLKLELHILYVYKFFLYIFILPPIHKDN